MKKIIVDEEKINILLNRGVSAIYPSKKFLEDKLKSGQQLTLYLGIDPTGSTLHLGHAIPLKKLREFQELGHHIILLIGDFTAMIGDPTDKSATRRQLTRKEVLDNLKNYKKQAQKIISFSGSNKASFKFNSKWLANLKFRDVINLTSKMTVQQMLERDMFDKRIKEGKSIHIHEFLYPLMQGYDSVAMNVDGEIGGNDQMFNMLCGRNLLKEMKNKEKFVITTKLLEDNSGKKMGKTEGNMVSMSDTPDEMYGKIMSWTDGLIIPGFELCTDVSFGELEKISKQLKNPDNNPKEIKVKLAEEIVSVFFGKTKAQKAKENWENTFSKKEIPEDILEIESMGNDLLVNLLLENHLVSSKSEFRRLIDEGAISKMSTDEKINDYNFIPSFDVYRIGKKRFCKIVIKA